MQLRLLKIHTVQIPSKHLFFFPHLAYCTLHFPCGPSLWLCLQTAFVRGHGRRPGVSRWSCRISEWARGRLPPLGRPRRRCNDAPDPCLFRSISLGLSGSWTASRKAAAPSPVPCCLHAGYPTPSPSPTTLSWHARYWIISLFSLPLPFLLWLWFSSLTNFPFKIPSPLLNLSRSVHSVFHRFHLEKERQRQSSDNTYPSESSSEAQTLIPFSLAHPAATFQPSNLTCEPLPFMTSLLKIIPPPSLNSASAFSSLQNQMPLHCKKEKKSFKNSFNSFFPLWKTNFTD